MKYMSVQFLINVLIDLKSFIYYWAGESPYLSSPFSYYFLISVKLSPGDTRLNFSPRSISEMMLIC